MVLGFSRLTVGRRLDVDWRIALLGLSCCCLLFILFLLPQSILPLSSLFFLIPLNFFFLPLLFQLILLSFLNQHESAIVVFEFLKHHKLVPK